MITPKLSRRKQASNHEFALLVLNALGCKPTGTEATRCKCLPAPVYRQIYPAGRIRRPSTSRPQHQRTIQAGDGRGRANRGNCSTVMKVGYHRE